MKFRVPAVRRSVVSLLIFLGLIAVSCSDHEMPTAPGGGASSSGAAGGSSGAGASGVADRGHGRGTVRVDPRRRGDDENRTPSPTVTGTPPTVTPTRTPRPGEAEIEGKIVTITAPSFTLMTRTGLVTVQTGPNTLFRSEGKIIGFGDLKAGQEVEVEGMRQGDGSILASKVQLEDEDEDEQEERTKTPTITPTPG